MYPLRVYMCMFAAAGVRYTRNTFTCELHSKFAGARNASELAINSINRKLLAPRNKRKLTYMESLNTMHAYIAFGYYI